MSAARAAVMSDITMSVTMQSHPAAEIFPMMAGADFEGLVADIRDNGQLEAIVIYNGMILDGRNRYKACQMLRIEPVTTDWVGTGTPEAFVTSMNLRRRHLGNGQRAMIAKRLATLSHGQKKADAQICASSQAEAAELLKVSRRSVQHAAVVLEKAVPELVQAVDRGAIPVSTAAQLVNLPKARQREIATTRGKLAARLAVKSARRIRTRKASRAHETRQPNLTPKEAEQHDRDLRILRNTWAATCESARAAFLKEQELLHRATIESARFRRRPIMPFDGIRRVDPPRPERVIVFAVRAPDLKAVIMDCYCEGRLAKDDVEDLIGQYGLHHD